MSQVFSQCDLKSVFYIFIHLSPVLINYDLSSICRETVSSGALCLRYINHGYGDIFTRQTLTYTLSITYPCRFIIFSSSSSFIIFRTGERRFTTTNIHLKDEQSWLSKLSSNLMVRKIEVSKHLTQL